MLCSITVMTSDEVQDTYRGVHIVSHLLVWQQWLACTQPVDK